MKKSRREGLMALMALLLMVPLQARPPREVDMSWWRADKFGLFMHWGLYSQAAGEWNGKKGFGEFIMLNNRIPIRQMYVEAAKFNPNQFDAPQWVRYAVDAGMKYLVITAKHHEGFAMWHSAANTFNIYDATPFKRDPLRELSDACDQQGIKFCVYYSLGRDWEDPDVPSNWPVVGGRSNDWDFPDEANKDFSRYFERKCKPQLIELLTNYNVHVLWFDTEGHCSVEQSRELLELVEKYRPGCLVNDRIGNGLGDFVTPEQKVIDGVMREPWESCITIGMNWGYTTHDTLYKSPEVITRLLTDIVAKGGNLLLNVGPTPWGTFSLPVVENLAAVGRWMRINSEAIYATTPWRQMGETHVPELVANLVGTEGKQDELKDETARGTEPDLRFTSKPGVVYVIARSWSDPQVRVNDLLLTPNERVKKVSLLGYNGRVEYAQQGNGIHFTLPVHYKSEIPHYVFKVELL